MKKITFLVAVFFVATFNLKAQVVSTVFGSTANEGIAEWTDAGGTFAQWFPENQADNGKAQSKTGQVGTASYTGAYSGTLSSTDVIFLSIRRIADRTPALDRMHVSYSQNGGSVETQSFVLPVASGAPQDLTITPGFTDGATLGDLSISFTQADGTSPAFDVFRIFEFSIGPNPNLSLKSNIIEGATVLGENGKITVEGAQLDAVYALTGQRVRPSGLSTGIYIAQISKGDLKATVKVVVD